MVLHPDSKITNRLRTIVERSSIVHRVVATLYARYVSIYAQVITWRQFGRNHAATINPATLLWVDPRDIDSCLTHEARDAFQYSDPVSEVVPGDWDTKTVSTREWLIYTSFKQHFEDGAAWEDTEFYHEILTRITSGTPTLGCESEEDLQERLIKVDSLYEQIREHGYLTQSEVRKQNYMDPIRRKLHNYWPPAFNEVEVAIDRNGDFLFHDGRHRFVISYLLNVDAIPVRIKTRHLSWQEVRDRAAQGKAIGSRHENHPDISV